MIFKDQLEAVYALIEDPKRWTQGSYAKDSYGAPSRICGEEACMWCLEGAALKLDLGLCDFGNALQLRSPVDFNDSHTHAEVLAHLNDAIERAPVRP